MKYIPRIPSEGINVKDDNTLIEFTLLASTLLVGTIASYALLGWIADRYVTSLSPRTEKAMVRSINVFPSGAFGDEKPNATLERLFNGLKHKSPKPMDNIEIHEACKDEINAFAVPGGKIIVLQGLIAQTTSEEELAFVVAHELGHFYHKHHLKGLGRGLLYMGLSAFIGSELPMMDQIVKVDEWVGTKFSQEDERMADLFAAQLFVKHYGHATGMKDFFTKLQEKERDPLLSGWMSSHPMTESRIKMLDALIAKHHWKEGTRTPLPPRSACSP